MTINNPPPTNELTTNCIIIPNQIYNLDTVSVQLMIKNTGSEPITGLIANGQLVNNSTGLQTSIWQTNNPQCSVNGVLTNSYSFISTNGGINFTYGGTLNAGDGLLLTFDLQNITPETQGTVYSYQLIQMTSSVYSDSISSNNLTFMGNRGPNLTTSTKSSSDVYVSPGSGTYFQLLLINTGTGQTSNVTILDDLDSNLTYVINSATISINGVISSLSASVDGSNNLTLSNIPSIPVNMTGIIQFQVIVSSSASDSNIFNSATIQYDNQPNVVITDSSGFRVLSPYYNYGPQILDDGSNTLDDYYVYEEENPTQEMDFFTINNGSMLFNQEINSGMYIEIDATDSPVVNPSWEIYHNGNLIANDAYFVTIPIGGQLQVSSYPENEYCVLYDENWNATNVYQYQDMSASNFVTIGQGANEIKFNIGSGHARFSIREEHFLV
jgi:uncharacterized repeat protein (TIGR01451 family)